MQDIKSGLKRSPIKQLQFMGDSIPGYMYLEPALLHCLTKYRLKNLEESLMLT